MDTYNCLRSLRAQHTVIKDGEQNGGREAAKMQQRRSWYRGSWAGSLMGRERRVCSVAQGWEGFHSTDRARSWGINVGLGIWGWRTWRTQHNSYSYLIVRTLSASVNFLNSTGVFGHRAIFDVGDRGMAWGFSTRTTRCYSKARYQLLCTRSCTPQSLSKT